MFCFQTNEPIWTLSPVLFYLLIATPWDVWDCSTLRIPKKAMSHPIFTHRRTVWLGYYCHLVFNFYYLDFCIFCDRKYMHTVRKHSFWSCDTYLVKFKQHKLMQGWAVNKWTYMHLDAITHGTYWREEYIIPNLKCTHLLKTQITSLLCRVKQKPYLAALRKFSKLCS